MKIKTLSLAQITPYARNPRRNQSAIATVKASLKEYGWQQPIVIDADGVIIAGENLKRKVRAIEISPAYVAVALERWATHTGKQPQRHEAHD